MPAPAEGLSADILHRLGGLSDAVALDRKVLASSAVRVFHPPILWRSALVCLEAGDKGEALETLRQWRTVERLMEAFNHLHETEGFEHYLRPRELFIQLLEGEGLVERAV